jgi:hypothetical protein
MRRVADLGNPESRTRRLLAENGSTTDMRPGM